MEGMRPPMQMNFVTGNVADNWRRWEQQFLVYYTACELSKKAKETQVAILLHAAGPEAQEIHETFTFVNDDDKKDYKAILAKFRTYCNPRKNVTYDRHLFWSRNQFEGESVDHWVTDLKCRAGRCEFGGESNNMVRDKIIFGVADDRLKERLLREPDLDINKALDICRAAEISRFQLQSMTGTANKFLQDAANSGSPEVNFIKKHSKQNSQPGKPKVHTSQLQITNCHYCGSSQNVDVQNPVMFFVAPIRVVLFLWAPL